MNRLRVSIFAAAFAFGAAPAFGDDGPAKPVGETDAKNANAPQAKAPRSLPTMADKQKAIDATTRASEEQPPKPTRGVIGDFPPSRC